MKNREEKNIFSTKPLGNWRLRPDLLVCYGEKSWDCPVEGAREKQSQRLSLDIEKRRTESNLVILLVVRASSNQKALNNVTCA